MIYVFVVELIAKHGIKYFLICCKKLFFLSVYVRHSQKVGFRVADFALFQ